MSPKRTSEEMVAGTISFPCKGRTITCTPKARFLVETANGTSSYTLERGFNEPEAAVAFYEDLHVGAPKKKRLTMIDEKKRVVLARS